MSNDEIKGLQQLIATHRQRLQVLKQQEALYGISVDPRIPIEIKDIETKIADLQKQIQKRTWSASDHIEPMNERGLLFEIQVDDVTLFESDVLALKFAQALYGADNIVTMALGKRQNDIAELLPNIGSYKLIDSLGRIKPKQVLFLSVVDLFGFGYEQIRNFSSDVLRALCKTAPDIRHLSMTVHGVGYGLDEAEALRSQLVGYFDALETGDFPQRLEKITLVERNEERARRLSLVLNNTLTINPVPVKRQPNSYSFKSQIKLSKDLSDVGRGSVTKPHIFTTFPNTSELEDMFFYGVQAPINAAGYLCENVDLSSPNTETLDRVTARVETASLIVAEITEQNPYIFFIIGYACAKQKPIILLSQSSDQVFSIGSNVQCAVYERIRDVEKLINQVLSSVST